MVLLHPTVENLYQQILKYSTEFNSFHMQDIRLFLKKVVEHVEHHQELFLSDMMLSMTRTFLYKTKFELNIVDTDEETATMAIPTDQPYCLEDYETVQDFFEELTGHGLATYDSGAGMVAENWEWHVQEQLEEMYHELVYSMSSKFEDEWAEVWETISIWLMDVVEEQMTRLKNTTFSWMVKSKSEEAHLLEMHLQDMHKQQQLEFEHKKKVSQYVHAQTKLLFKKDKYVIDDKEEMFEALSQLSALISPEYLSIYLHSSSFAAITSINLRELIHKKYPLIGL